MSNKNQQLVQVHNNLESLLKSKAQALPKDFNQTRFLQNAMTVLQDTKDIEKMDPKSVACTMLKGAFLGLDFFNKECYAIPYGNQLQFQTDYRGEIKLVRKHTKRKVLDVYAKIVRVGDRFQESVRDGKQSLTFDPKPFNQAEIVGVFAVCYFADGGMVYETMPKDEVEKIRQVYSKVPNGPAWKNSWEEMAKKTVLRRLCKLLKTEMEFENQDAAQAYEEGGDVEFTDFEEVQQEPVRMPRAIDEEPEPEPQKQAGAPIDEKELIADLRKHITRRMSEFQDIKAIKHYQEILAKHEIESPSKVSNIDRLQACLDDLNEFLKTAK